MPRGLPCISSWIPVSPAISPACSPRSRAAGATRTCRPASFPAVRRGPIRNPGSRLPIPVHAGPCDGRTRASTDDPDTVSGCARLARFAASPTVHRVGVRLTRTVPPPSLQDGRHKGGHYQAGWDSSKGGLDQDRTGCAGIVCQVAQSSFLSSPFSSRLRRCRVQHGRRFPELLERLTEQLTWQFVESGKLETSIRVTLALFAIRRDEPIDTA